MTQNKPTVTIISGRTKLRKIADRPVLEKYVFSTTAISPNLTAAEQKKTEDQIIVQENILVDDLDKGFSIEIDSAKFPDKIGRKSRKNSKQNSKVDSEEVKVISSELTPTDCYQIGGESSHPQSVSSIAHYIPTLPVVYEQ